MSADEPEVKVELVMRDSDGPTIELRQVVLGHEPMVLIEPIFDDTPGQESVTFKIDATDLGLKGLRELFADVLVPSLDQLIRNNPEVD